MARDVGRELLEFVRVLLMKLLKHLQHSRGRREVGVIWRLAYRSRGAGCVGVLGDPQGRGDRLQESAVQTRKWTDGHHADPNAILSPRQVIRSEEHTSE